MMEMDLETSLILKNLMSHTFSLMIRPSNVLPLLEAKSQEIVVLTDGDFSEIRATTTIKGDVAGATMLLNFMSKYRGWFEVLQEVLRHRDVNQAPLAEKFEQMKDEAVTIRFKRTVVQQDNHPNPSCNADSTTNPVLIQHSISSSTITSEDDFALDDDEPRPFVMDDSQTLTTDAPKPMDANDNKCSESSPVPEVSQSCSNPSRRTATSIPKEDDERRLEQGMQDLSTTQGEREYANQQFAADEDGYTEVDDPSCSSVTLRPKSQTEEEYKTYDEVDYVPETPSGARPKGSTSRPTSSQYETTSCPRAEEKSTYWKSGSRSHEKRSEMYDFSREETECGLSSFPGWHPDQNDKKVLRTFRRILEERLDGHYMVWYWEKKKRPSICVSHKGRLVTFVIHRRPDKESHSQNRYYINKHQPQPTLQQLFQYHKERGLPDMREQGSLPVEHIKLLFPIDPVTGPDLDQ